MEQESIIKTSLYMPKPLLKRLKDEAYEKGCSVNSLIQSLAEGWLNGIKAVMEASDSASAKAASEIHGALQQSGLLSSVPKAEQVASPVSPVYGGVLNSETVTSTRLHTILDELLESDQRAHIIALLLYAREWAENHSKEHPGAISNPAIEEFNRLYTEGKQITEKYFSDDSGLSGNEGESEKTEPDLRKDDGTPGRRRRKEAG